MARAAVRLDNPEREKNPAVAGFFERTTSTVSGGSLDVRCLLAFRTLHHFEGHLLTFF
jgi:hypothetical protein